MLDFSTIALGFLSSKSQFNLKSHSALEPENHGRDYVILGDPRQRQWSVEALTGSLSSFHTKARSP